ncbi:conserved hypothetical protein, partial [Ricinus communis]
GADTAAIESIERCVGMFRAAGGMASVDDGRDAGIETGERGEPGAEIHIQRSIMAAQCFRHHIDIGKEIVHIGHHAAHCAQPHVMMGVDQTWHDDAVRSIDNRCIGNGEVLSDGRYSAVFHEQVADGEIAGCLVHCQYGAAFEKRAGMVEIAHDWVLSGLRHGTVIALE